MKSQGEFIRAICTALEQASIPYMIGGSVASSMGESERQFQDAANVALTRWHTLDFPYLDKWAVELDIVASLNELKRQVQAVLPTSLNPEP
jgi:hypothetical protein